MDLVAEIVAFVDMFIDVFHCPGAGDDGLDTEDVGLGTVNFGLDDTGDVGLEFNIVNEEEFAVFVDRDEEVAFVGALFEVARVEAENAGGVGGYERDAWVAAIVVAVDGDVDVVAVGGEFNGLVVANFGFEENGVVGIDVIVAKVERDVDEFDSIVGEEADFDTVGLGE